MSDTGAHDEPSMWSEDAQSGNPLQNVSFPSNGGRAYGYLALPGAGSGPGLIVIQEWWGLTDHIASLAERFAAEGFVALAPDLYGGRTAHDGAEAFELMKALPADRAARDLSGAVDYLLGNAQVTSTAVGAVGFCMGGGFVLTLAEQQGDRVAAAVPFYGFRELPQDVSRFTAALQGHYGSEDQMVPIDKVEELAARVEAQTGHKAEIHVYPAGHAFLNDENHLGTYDREQAAIAWERAVTFLHSKLG
jgi:carboxymethylenebutenolidase